jgi:hypothetical protein
MKSQFHLTIVVNVLHIGILSRLLTFAVWIAAGHCNAFALEAQDEGIAYFEKHIRPLFIKHCYQCHSTKAKEAEGGLLLDSRSGWLEGGASGTSVIAGDVEASTLIRAVRYQDPSIEMPPAKPLSSDEVTLLENWVRMGAPGPHEVDSSPPSNPSDPIAGKEHWAFLPLAVNSVASSIDDHIRSKLSKEQLRPNDRAKPRDLIRRVYFQLVGLPPSSAEVDAFLSDDSQESLERVVDRLLASAQFGERWGRHWLDLARYADSNGLDENFLFREAWRYRNWVIASINRDMPFDRFLTEQIAGDLLEYDSIEQRDNQRIAAGFLAIGPKVLLGNNENNQRMEVADEQIDTIGRAVLGQTLGCARCHDHKFDPIPTADYYALAGIFASTSVLEKRHMLNEQRVMERLEGLGEKGQALDDAYELFWREQPELKKRSSHATAFLNALQTGHCEELAALQENNREGIAPGALDSTKALEARIQAQKGIVDSLKGTIDNSPKIPPRAMTPRDSEEPQDESIRIAGQFDQLGEKVARGGLQVLTDQSPFSVAGRTSGRLEFAHWLTRPENRASHLVARVQANRIWHHLMGVGIVRTVDNFGRTGEAPTHPELLDYLASEFIHSGWSLKSLVRKIVLSETFARSSNFDSANHALDPDNHFWWRGHRRRHDPESFRDSMLSVAGQLDLKPVDSTVGYLGDQATAVGANKNRRRTDFLCRSIYLPIIRNDLPEVFQAFDFADPQSTTGARPKTIVPTQGLFMLNDAMVMDASEAMAKRILAEGTATDTDSKIDRMVALVLNAIPTENERKNLSGFLADTAQGLNTGSTEERELRALTLACHALFASSRFQTME